MLDHVPRVVTCVSSTKSYEMHRKNYIQNLHRRHNPNKENASNSSSSLPKNLQSVGSAKHCGFPSPSFLLGKTRGKQSTSCSSMVHLRPEKWPGNRKRRTSPSQLQGRLGKTFSKVQSQKPVQGPQPSGKISLGLTCVLALPRKQKWVVVGGKMHNAKKKSSRRRGGTHILNTLGPASHAGSFELTIKQTRPQKTTPKNWCIPTTCSAPNKQASTHVFFLP